MRRGGLGPQGHQAIAKAAATHATIPRLPRISEGNAAAIDAELPDEDETAPQTWRMFDSTRVREAGYSPQAERLYVRFVKPDGSVVYVYEGVPKNVWKNMQRSASAGKYINRTLNNYDYHRIS